MLKTVFPKIPRYEIKGKVAPANAMKACGNTEV